MINRIYIKELLSFKEVDLEISPGLIVITGPSGAGKSVLINAVLANFGLQNAEAKICEIELNKPKDFKLENYEIDDDFLFIKSIKKDRVRYLLNSQNISKKALKEAFKNYVLYLSVRDKGEFDSNSLLEMLDNYLINTDKNYFNLLNDYNLDYKKLKQKEQELNDILQKIKQSDQRVEFLKFEIQKIKNLNPKVGEYEELLKIKKQLSKLDKINELATKVNEIFSYEDAVIELFNMLDKDSSYFSDTMNNLRSELEDINTLASELDEINIEEVLDRLEELASLIKRFGSIKEALRYLKECEEELNSFEVIQEDLTSLKNEINTLKEKLLNSANEISKKRKSASSEIEKKISNYLKELKLPGVKFIFSKQELAKNGVDLVELTIKDTKTSNLSGGEFNRLRLALLSATTGNAKKDNIIILDEIDANVSGDESIAIANMIKNLSKSYQVFAISHQPHLSAKANTHILVTKTNDTSSAKILDKEQRVKEIARIVGGENLNKESIEFAKKLISEEK
jgi:DNA repair protein RecN (Recombination protein N)